MTPTQMAAIHAAAMTTPRPWSAAEFASLLSLPGTFSTGATAHGFALGRVVLDEAELLTIATHPDHRRAGLARQNLTQFHATAATLGATRVFLEVAADNAAARALYGAAGYAITGTRRGYYRSPGGDATDAIAMMLPLPAS